MCVCVYCWLPHGTIKTKKSINYYFQLFVLPRIYCFSIIFNFLRLSSKQYEMNFRIRSVVFLSLFLSQSIHSVLRYVCDYITIQSIRLHRRQYWHKTGETTFQKGTDTISHTAKCLFSLFFSFHEYSALASPSVRAQNGPLMMPKWNKWSILHSHAHGAAGWNIQYILNLYGRKTVAESKDMGGGLGTYRRTNK